MSRTHVPAGLVAALLLFAAGDARAQPPAAPSGVKAFGAGGSGLQPQVNTGVYQPFTADQASRGLNPFAGPVLYPAYPPPVWFPPRSAPAPLAFAPAPGGAVNNPVLFNAGVMVPFPLAIPPALGPGGGPLNPVAFNPIFVARPAVVSAYYAPPLAVGQPWAFRSNGSDGRVSPTSGSLADPVAGAAMPADGSPDSRGTEPAPQSDAGTFASPSSGIVFAPGQPRFLPWLW